MASVINRPNGNRWIQFTDDGGRRTLRLGRVPLRDAEEVKRRVESILANRASGLSMDRATAIWIADATETLRRRINRVGLLRIPDPVKGEVSTDRVYRPHIKDRVQTQKVYFVGCRTTDEIKIGIAANVKHRVRVLASNYPGDLVLLGTIPGGREKEEELHGRFLDSHVRGEWFRWSKIEGSINEILLERDADPEPDLFDLKAAQTHCIRNHILDGPNLRLRPNGQRVCVACERMREQGRRPRHREKAVS